MGCGGGRKKTKEKSKDHNKNNSQDNSQDNIPTHKMLMKPLGTPCDQSSMKESATVQGSVCETERENKCSLCSGITSGKSHILDCGHFLCLEHAKTQLENKIKNNEAIMFYCKICYTPKNISMIS